MIPLLLLACGSRAPETPPTPPEEAVHQRVVDEDALSLRCAGEGCGARVEALLERARQDPEAAWAALEGEEALLKTGGLWRARGAWPVKLDHPALDGEDLLAELELVDSALAVYEQGPRWAAVAHLDSEAAQAAARALVAEADPRPVTEAGAWALWWTEGGLLSELGEAKGRVRGVKVTP